jgi:hypothetical protein
MSGWYHSNSQSQDALHSNGHPSYLSNLNMYPPIIPAGVPCDGGTRHVLNQADLNNLSASLDFDASDLESRFSGIFFQYVDVDLHVLDYTDVVTLDSALPFAS